MSKTRFTPWIVLACIGTLAGCTSGEGGTAGNTELNVVIPNNGSQSPAPDGSPQPAAFDIEVVEYTIACNDGIDSGPFLDNGATLDDDVTISGALEVLDTASTGVTIQDFGPDLTEVYVWQGFMDLPPTNGCSVQLRARDADGEVICTSTVNFDIAADTTTKVNVLMYCDVSFQAPVGMLDLDGDFSFNVSNFCPDLFVLNCVDPDLEELLTVPGLGSFVYSGCQVRFRDGDSQCGDSCDPQTCVTTPEGLDCTPGPDPLEPTTTVTCDNPGFFCAIPGNIVPGIFGTPCTPAPGDFCFDASGGTACAPGALMNCGGTTADPFCEFTGDTLGAIGDGPPAPLAVGTGGFLVGCTVADDDGDPLTPPVALAPGATVTCTADTTDGDADCDKQKTVEVSCPGLTPCQVAGPGFCDDGTACTADSCDDSTGVAVCSNTAVADGTDCSAELPPSASCTAGVCISDACTSDASCETADECTFAGPGICDIGTGVCGPLSPEPGGTSCDAGGGAGSGACDGGGACVDNCAATICDDGNECTDDPACVSVGGPTCPPSVIDDTNSCTTCVTGTCACSGGACIDSGCPTPAPVDAVGIPMACRNSFNNVVSVFPIDLENVTPDACIEDSAPFNVAIDPTIALDTAFLQAAADTLCATGLALTEADVGAAQIRIDAVAGATCTSQLSVLPGTPVTVFLDVTIVGTCGAGGTITVNSGISLPLPTVNMPCTAGTAGSEVQICSTGTVPLSILAADPPTDTFVAVVVGGGFISVAFQCNTSSTTNPAPGTTISCTAPNPAGECVAVGSGDVGETPFPASDCDFSDGFPGECTTVPVGVDPSTTCATFPVVP